MRFLPTLAATLAALRLLLAPAAADPFDITWAAAFDNGFTLSDGITPLPLGNEIRFGTFGSFSDPAIQYLIELNDLIGLSSHFTQLDSAQVGEAFSSSELGMKPLANRAGHFEATFSADTDALGVNGKTAAFWVFRTVNNQPVNATYSNVLEVGVFYLASPLWTIPSGFDPAPAFAVDITDLTNAAGTTLVSGAHVVSGGFPSQQTSTYSGKPNFTLHLIPEPQVLGLVGSAVAMLAWWRPRRRR